MSSMIGITNKQLQTCKAAAIAAAAADATTKANAAQVAAQSYADTKKAEAIAAGAFTTGSKNDSLGNPISKVYIYKVSSDGFIIIEPNCAGYPVSIKMGPTSSPPERYTRQGYGGNGMIFPILKDEYFQIVTDATYSYIHWQPTGSGTCVKQ